MLSVTDKPRENYNSSLGNRGNNCQIHKCVCNFEQESYNSDKDHSMFNKVAAFPGSSGGESPLQEPGNEAGRQGVLLPCPGPSPREASQGDALEL